MKKEILITLLCASLMLVTPFTTVARENTVSNNLPDEADIDGLVAQIRTVVDEILEKYGHIQVIGDFCNVILMIMDLSYLLLFCIFLVIITIPIFLLFVILMTLNIFPPTIASLLFLLIRIFGDDCSPSTSLINLLPSLNALLNLSETRDITNLIMDCPCLQE